MKAIDNTILERAQSWTRGDFDEAIRSEVRAMLAGDPSVLTDAFYRDLEFGTGGLRGIMGAGTNRMNKYTVGMATQGFANYLNKMFPGPVPIRVAVAYDSRNNSRFFARITSEVFAANGMQVFLFDDLRPTPELSYAIRHLGCRGGVMVTASHNPKEYNGYKAYWDDGGQLVEPHDSNVIREVKLIHAIDQVRWEGNPELIVPIGETVDNAYLDQILGLSLSPGAITRQRDLKIVYTPLHGAGRKLVPEVLKRFGFRNIRVVEEQATADGNFPTVHSPNPEEPDALDMAIKRAEKENADLVMATDPDADRVGIAVKGPDGKFILLNGNQTAALLFYYILTRWNELGRFTGNEYIVKTIVTTELLRDMARSFDLDCVDVLTGFKYIAHVIRQQEGVKSFIVGGEESYGYLVGDFVRDKDAVSACAFIAEASAWIADQGRTLFDLLLDIYTSFSFYKESLVSLTRKGKEGAEEIRQIMIEYRSHPMSSINNTRVGTIRDYLSGEEKEIGSGAINPIQLPASDVLQFILEDGSVISIRPSGTEPKIKYYIGVRETLGSQSDYHHVNRILDEKVDGIVRSMNLKEA